MMAEIAPAYFFFVAFNFFLWCLTTFFGATQSRAAPSLTHSQLTQVAFAGVRASGAVRWYSEPESNLKCRDDVGRR